MKTDTDRTLNVIILGSFYVVRISRYSEEMVRIARPDARQILADRVTRTVGQKTVLRFPDGAYVVGRLPMPAPSED